MTSFSHPQRITALAPAKINLGLDVLGRRPDGYHELRMVMQSVSVCDTLTFERTGQDRIVGTCSRDGLPMDEHNLVMRAAHLLREEFSVADGLSIHLEKRIPMAAGLAGGSTDAAATLIALNRLWGLGLSREALMERGVRLGADIPFCILGGTALAEGIGEKLTPLAPAPGAAVLLAKPPVDVSTAAVYGALHAAGLQGHPDIDGQVQAVQAHDFDAICRLCGNVLETVTVPMHPVIEELKAAMHRAGAAVTMMSGSGPTVFGLFYEGIQAEKAKEKVGEMFAQTELFTAEFTAGVTIHEEQ